MKINFKIITITMLMLVIVQYMLSHAFNKNKVFNLMTYNKWKCKPQILYDATKG